MSKVGMPDGGRLRAQKQHKWPALGWVALAVSLVVGAGLWTEALAAGTLYGITGPNAPGWEDVTWNLLIYASPALILTVIVLDIVTGWRGGRNRLLAAVGGAAMLSSAVPFIVYVSGFLT